HKIRHVDPDLQAHFAGVGGGGQTGMEADFGNVEGTGYGGTDRSLFLVTFIGIASECIVTLLGEQADALAPALRAQFVVLAVPLIERRVESDQIASARVVRGHRSL